ncbi:MAG: hypothetical protein JXQ83_00110 [Candidatus Glassbacteria bacterium]|nr:hypothetical protein [Candidatus Glassbacteria bacterium]
MISRELRVIDLDPVQWARFASVCARLSGVSPQLVLWHEESLSRRQLLDGRSEPVSIFRVDDARLSARELYDRYHGKLRRVVVSDLDGYDRLYAAQNLKPEPNEEKYHYLARMYQAVCAEFDRNVAIYPEPCLDRGPAAYLRMRSFLQELLPGPCCLILAVFDGQDLFCSLVARVSGSEVDLVAGFDHWGDALAGVSFSGTGLETAMQVVGRDYGEVAGAVFLSRRDFELLYDGELHDSLPGSAVPGSTAYGFSNRPDPAGQALLCTTGLFAYAPVVIP